MLPYLSELEFGMFTSVYIAQPFPGRKGELHGAIAVPLLCQTLHPLPAGLRIGTNCPSWTFLGCEWLKCEYLLFTSLAELLMLCLYGKSV